MTRVVIGLVMSLVPAVAMCTESCPVVPEYTYYAVQGSSIEQLETALRQKGPRDEQGVTRFAYTSWTVQWDWMLSEHGAVVPESIKLTCIATIHLPTIESRESLSADLLTEWDGFIERTRRHELNHVKHVEDLAPRILVHLRKAARRSGKLSRKAAESIVEDGIARIRAKDREYDLATSHGKTEGTWRIRDPRPQ